MERVIGGRPVDHGPGRHAVVIIVAVLKHGQPELPEVTQTLGLPTDQLNLAPALASEWQRSRSEITPENAGERCFLRLERQPLTRLPRTGGVLFTIHTYLHLMAEVSQDPARARRLASVLRGMPQATRDYKGMMPYLDALLAYVDKNSSRP